MTTSCSSPTTNKSTRALRTKSRDIERLYFCNYPGCDKGYGLLSHLNDHVRIQSHGKRRTPVEFREVRLALKKKKKDITKTHKKNSIDGMPEVQPKISETAFSGLTLSSPITQEETSVEPISEQGQPVEYPIVSEHPASQPVLPPLKRVLSMPSDVAILDFRENQHQRPATISRFLSVPQDFHSAQQLPSLSRSILPPPRLSTYPINTPLSSSLLQPYVSHTFGKNNQTYDQSNHCAAPFADASNAYNYM